MARSYFVLTIFLVIAAMACGGAEFAVEPRGSDAGGGRDAVEDTQNPASDAEATDANSPPDGPSLRDGSDIGDGTVGEPRGDSGFDANDDGGTPDAPFDASDASRAESGTDSGQCGAPGQCDANHPCPTGSFRVMCCPSIVVGHPCGICIRGSICPL